MVVDYQVRGRIALITLNRPEARNAINPELTQALAGTLEAFEGDDEVWIGILAGNGPVFSAGADLKSIAAGKSAELGTAEGGLGGFVTYPRSKPVIAAVDGPAFAGGCEFVLACDLVVASARAKFGLPEVKRSLLASAGGVVRLPRQIPLNVAMEMGLTGDPIDADRAHQLGLVNVLCEPGEAITAAEALAERITVNAPLAVRKTREAIIDSWDLGEEEAIRESRRLAAALRETEDYAEGPRAFIEKRDPVWQAR